MGQGKLVSFTVKNSKVYVGYVISNFNPASPMRSIKILPAISGYRHDKTKTINFTTRYLDIYEKIRVGDETVADLDSANFEIVIAVQEIQSANIFDENIYRRYFNQPIEEPTAQKPESKTGLASPNKDALKSIGFRELLKEIGNRIKDIFS